VTHASIAIINDQGCVQEEIRFLISPELIVARLFCAEFDDNEVRRLVAPPGSPGRDTER
jgi:hypothetical protein